MIDLTTIEQPDRAIAIHFKDEESTPAGSIGPAWWVVERPSHAYPVLEPVAESDQLDWNRQPYPQWFYLSQIEELGERLEMEVRTA